MKATSRVLHVVHSFIMFGCLSMLVSNVAQSKQVQSSGWLLIGRYYHAITPLTRVDIIGCVEMTALIRVLHVVYSLTCLVVCICLYPHCAKHASEIIAVYRYSALIMQ